jgi:hypothetical protein
MIWWNKPWSTIFFTHHDPEGFHSFCCVRFFRMSCTWQRSCVRSDARNRTLHLHDLLVLPTSESRRIVFGQPQKTRCGVESQPALITVRVGKGAHLLEDDRELLCPQIRHKPYPAFDNAVQAIEEHVYVLFGLDIASPKHGLLSDDRGRLRFLMRSRTLRL